VETQKALQGHQFPLCDQWEPKAEEKKGKIGWQTSKARLSWKRFCNLVRDER
jgi:hypothetical protein